MVKATIKKQVGEVTQKNTGEALRPLSVAVNEYALWYSTLLPDIGFPEPWDACVIDRFMCDGHKPHTAMRTLKRGIALKSPSERHRGDRWYTDTTHAPNCKHKANW